MSNFKDRQKHPSHGVIRIHRVSGHARLFRSALTHQHYITLSVCEADVIDSGIATDFISSGKEIVEVSMSESQFARMITSMNMGSGSPVTISRLHGKLVPEPPYDDRKGFVAAGHSEHIKNKNNKVAEIVLQLQKCREDGKRPTMAQVDDMIYALTLIVNNFASDHEFYRERFVEEMEHVVDEAKTEIEAHISQTAARLGMEELKNQLPRIAGD